MTDQQPQLRQMLEQLDAELKRTQTADETQRQQLHAVQKDVQALLERSGEASPAEHQPMVERWRTDLRHFESSHPNLTSLIEQVLSTLSGAGI